MTTSNKPAYWRSLAELEQTPQFKEFVHREFPVAASEFPDGVSRRRWLQLMGASFALTTAAGCRWQTEKIAPFADRPENRIPGEPQRYATSIELACGTRHLLVTCYDGRPVKVEGNPQHPQSRGATDSFAQASVLDLYDPDRSGELRQRSQRQQFSRTWDDFEQWLLEQSTTVQSNDGANFAVLVEPSESPSLRRMLESLQSRLPQAKIYQYSALSRDNERAGNIRAFGKPLRSQLIVERAKVIVCLDDDLLGEHPDALRHISEFARRRDPDKAWMNRLYCVESQFSTTGSMADHRLALPSSNMGGFLNELEAAVRQRLQESNPAAPEDRRQRMLIAMADDLVQHRGNALITVGPRQPAAVHERAQRLNGLLGNLGRTVRLLDDAAQVTRGSLVDLVQRIEGGGLQTLLILGGNPAYSAPAGTEFAAAVDKVEHTIHLSRYYDETSRRCEWHLPQTHAFESWGDVRGEDGTYSVTQPLIEPLLNGRSALEVLALFTGKESRDGQAIVRDTAKAVNGGRLSDQAWRRTLHDGFLSGTRHPIVDAELLEPHDAVPAARESLSEDELELVFCAADTVYDGSFANNGWLQETPDFLTKLTWDNAAILSPATAKRLGMEQGTLIRLDVDGRELTLPAFTLPGQADNSIGVALGFGRREAGFVGGSESNDVAAVGFDANQLRHEPDSYVVRGVRATPTGQAYELATTQDHHAIDSVGLEEIGRRVGKLVREATRDEYRDDPNFVQHGDHHPPLESLWKEPSYDGHAWGMAIDLNKCVGCSACVVACQSENNIPIVGKEQVAVGREMHWIRTDRYFVGDVKDPQVAHQPVACHHCENAPCEQVCPVAATVHSDEGLNDMVYNRCVGTRYCANNCPYKVRRFNFFDYNAELESPRGELVQLGVNPEVTVRSRGVMEKCTYCVQRIQRVKIDAKNDGRPIADGEIVTACQQACPAEAIEFGDLNDPDSRVAKAHRDSRSYGMLAELNVKPRTKYLARIRNPHPLLDRNPAHHPSTEDEQHGHSG